MSVHGHLELPAQAAARSHAAARASAALAVIASAQLMVVLDATIVNVALAHGANLIMLCVGTAIVGMFLFLTLTMQSVLGYSTLRTGVALFPLTATIIVTSGVASLLLPRLGACPMLLTGSAALGGGLLWMSRISEHSSYPAAILGLLFVPLSVVAMSRVPATDSGAASGLLDAGQQADGSIGLAVIGTLAWTTMASSHYPVSRAAASRALPAAVHRHALATGSDRVFLAVGGIALPARLITILTIRVPRADFTSTRK